MLGVVAALAVSETVLRACHFRFQAIPEVQFGWPEPSVIQHDFESDPEVLWVPRDYRARLARAATAEILFLGDSCVAFSTYPAIVLGRLATQGHAWSSEVLAVPGWSSEQGRAQMQRDVSRLHPRVVTVEFGWNDHWDALGPPDAETHSGWLIRWAADHVRVYQAYRKAVLGVQRMREPDGPRRVGLDRYPENLRAIVDMGTRLGARVVLVTAPANHQPGAEPEYLRPRHLRHLERLVPLHRAYVSVTREVAATTGATVCDVADAFARMTPTIRRRLFRADGIHFSAAGDRVVGELVARCIEPSLGPVSPAP